MSNNWGCSCWNNRRREDRMPCQTCRNERDHWDNRRDERRDDRRDWRDNRDERREERRDDRHEERRHDRCNWCNRNNNWRW